jgi:hypothetical protein
MFATMIKIKALFSFLVAVYTTLPLFAQNLSYLQNVQSKIDSALTHSFAQQNTAPLDSILTQLAALTPQSNLTTYWQSYARSMVTIYFMKMKQTAKAESAINRACDDMEKLDKKNTEDYALLASVQNLAIQFRSGMGAGKLSSQAVENAQKAIQMDSTNLRAWYVLGTNDFYTPAFFGGGKKTEQYLTKALSCPAQRVPNPYMPSWGREESYHLLLTYYVQKEQYEPARILLNAAKAEYPNGRWFISQFEQQLKKAN